MSLWTPQNLPLASLDRRRFLQATAAVGLAGITGTQPSRAAEPKRGGHLKIGLARGDTNDSLDFIAVTPTPFTLFTNKTYGNFLTEIDHEGHLVGEIAEDWESSPDATRWVFRIRRGITFHNGKSLTPQDVVASLVIHQGEDSRSPAKVFLAGVTDIRADGDNVIIDLANGNADLPYLLSADTLPILPADADGRVNLSTGIGCGAYILRSFEPGVRVLFERNPNYWKSHRGHFDSVEALSIVDATARTNALISGEVHVIDNCDLKTADRLAAREGINVTRVTSGQHYVFAMLTNTPPFDNPDVRRALKLVVDREEMVQKVLSGYGTVGNDHPIAPGMPFYADLEQRTYDPEQARFLLKRAGVDGLSVALSVSDAAFQGSVDAAVLYRERAAQAGIDIQVVHEPNDGYWSNVWKKKPWVASLWRPRPTPDAIFSTVYAADAEWNETRWNHPRFNELLMVARSELDPMLRAEMYQEMQQLVRDHSGTVIPMFADFVEAHADTLAYETPIGNSRALDGDRIAERWWFT